MAVGVEVVAVGGLFCDIAAILITTGLLNNVGMLEAKYNIFKIELTTEPL